MADNNIHAQVIDLICRAEEAAYERGKADAKRELLAFLGAKVSMVSGEPKPSLISDASTDRPAQERQRAPKGIVPKFIINVLRRHASANRGLTAKKIVSHAETDFEKMIKIASIRGELRTGRNDGRFREDGGRWFLANDGGESEEAEARATDSPASFLSPTERG